MNTAMPEQPPLIPDDKRKAGLKAWTARWATYRKELVAQLASLLERHDNARELVAELRDYCRALEDDTNDPRQWKRAIVAKGADQFYVRHHGDSFDRDTIVRKPDGRWAVSDLDDGDIEVPAGVAQQLLTSLFFWGDLTAIYKAKSYLGPAGFIPPEGYD